MFYIYNRNEIVLQNENFDMILNWYRHETNYYRSSDDVYKKNPKLALTKQNHYDNYRYEFKHENSVFSYTTYERRCYYVLNQYNDFINMWNYKDYILYDGGMPAEDFVYGQLCTTRHYYWRKAPTFRFRCEPVPHTRKRRGGNGQDSERVQQERRMTFACEDKTLIRGKRSLRSLPNPWDEYHQRCIQKNWKVQSKSKHQHGYDAKKLRDIKHYIDEEYFEED